MIMQRIMEDFIEETRDLLRKKSLNVDRLIGLQMFTKRLTLLNNEKFSLLVQRYTQANDMFNTVDKEVSIAFTKQVF